MFLYVDNQGEAFQSANEPDAESLEQIDAGELRCFEMRIGQGFFEATTETIPAEGEEEEDEFELGWDKVSQR